MKILGADAAEDRKQKIQSMMYTSVPKPSQNSATTGEVSMADEEFYELLAKLRF